jgi:hypothetical protein
MAKESPHLMRRCLLACALLWPCHAAFGRLLSLAPATPSVACLAAIASAERQWPLPEKLLGTIALVESGRPDPVTGRTMPWPWSIDVEGVDHVYPDKATAIAAVQDLQAAGVRSIDVGCMQINLLHHPNAFASLDAAFDPTLNVAYGARFLEALHGEFGNWAQAAAAYHSRTAEIAQDYESRVMALWPLASLYPDPTPRVGAQGVSRAPPSPAPDYSRYTPEFAARVRQMVADRAQLQARFGAVVQPTPAPVAPRQVRVSFAAAGSPVQ